ncbi:hypothetical protein Hsero_3810 [Herbaspirillum seropedicae SmR1]|uniref:Uncharacterized protein n=1 Tax=Herbaspirillum seropedicae (strain SmR1) TaxID=757424 RepID=D8IRU5_HERSS|nr:hypothetical protein Hsero_3810 [Herbaspirillum seropedicae SmR1]
MGKRCVQSHSGIGSPALYRKTRSSMFHQVRRNLSCPQKGIGHWVLFTAPVFHCFFIAVGIFPAVQRVGCLSPSYRCFSARLIVGIVGGDNADFFDILRPDRIAAGPKGHQAMTGQEQNERHHANAIRRTSAHPQVIHAEQETLQHVFLFFEEKQWLGQLFRTAIHVPAPVVPLRQQAIEAFLPFPLPPDRKGTNHVTFFIHFIMTDVIGVPVIGISAVNAEYGVFIPRDFPCNIALTRLGEEPATPNGVEFLLFTIETDGTALKRKKFVSSVPESEVTEQNSDGQAIEVTKNSAGIRIQYSRQVVAPHSPDHP